MVASRRREYFLRPFLREYIGKGDFMYMKNNYKKRPDKENWIKNILIVIVLVVGIQFLFLRAYNVNLVDIRDVFLNGQNKNLLLQEFIVNIEDDNRVNSYLRIQISLECKDRGNKIEAEKNIDKIRDIVIMDLVDRNKKDFEDYKGISRVSDQLRDKINSKLGRKVVEEIYIVRILTQ